MASKSDEVVLDMDPNGEVEMDSKPWPSFRGFVLTWVVVLLWALFFFGYLMMLRYFFLESFLVLPIFLGYGVLVGFMVDDSGVLKLFSKRRWFGDEKFVMVIFV